MGNINAGWTYSDRVTAKGAGQTVLDFYVARYHHSDANTWQQRIEAGQILINDRPVTPATVLERGQTVTYRRSPWQEPEVPLALPILHQDPDLWAVHKPSGLPVLPGGEFVHHTVLQQLKIQYPDESLTPLHRLGRGTSGVLLLGRSPLARRSLSQQFREQQCRKVYRALVTAGDLPEHFECHQAIGKIPYAQLGYLYAASPTGKPAFSQGRVLARFPDRTLVEVEIRTGRPHQIRIHLAALGFPLWNDPLYTVGGIPADHHTAIPSDCGYWLHAHRLGFTHPRREEWLEIQAPLPEGLELLPSSREQASGKITMASPKE